MIRAPESFNGEHRSARICEWEIHNSLADTQPLSFKLKFYTFEHLDVLTVKSSNGDEITTLPRDLETNASFSSNSKVTVLTFKKGRNGLTSSGFHLSYSIGEDYSLF